jgi:hypothetical protein
MSRRVTRAMTAAQEHSTLECVLALEKSAESIHSKLDDHSVIRGVETRLDAHLSKTETSILASLEIASAETKRRDVELKRVLNEHHTLLQHVMDLVKPITLPIWNAVVFDGRREGKPLSVVLYSKSTLITSITLQKRDGIYFHGWNGTHVLMTPYADETTRALPFFAYKVEWKDGQGIMLVSAFPLEHMM